MFSYSFEIAGITVALKTEKPILISKRFLPFMRKEECVCDYEAFFRQVDRFSEMPSVWLQKEAAFDVGVDSNGYYYRRFRDMKHDEKIYAVAFYDWRKKHIEVEYLSCGQRNLSQSDNCFFHIAWETIMQLENRMILHACAVDTSYGGILFSGRSGVGKSTQGALWCQYEGAALVNGDRPFIKKEDKIWYAYGAPYAGSSGCYLDARTPIRAIVFLTQSETCTIRKLNPAEAFRNIYAGMTLSTWNPECVANICDLATLMVSEVPMYEMGCTPDRQAVELLKQTLKTEETL
ncbi:MAG: hypothetical protein ACI4S2_14950 [Lachnospiraceae bacterium]